MKRLVILTSFSVFVCGCLLSCGQVEKRTHEQQMETAKFYIDSMKSLGFEVQGFANIPLRAGWHTKAEIGSDGNVFLWLDWKPTPDIVESIKEKLEESTEKEEVIEEKVEEEVEKEEVEKEEEEVETPVEE